MLNRFFAFVVAAFAVLGVAVAINHFIAPPYNDGFARHPIIVKAHVVLGAIYLFFGAFQFSPYIRRKWISYHKSAGRLLAATALVVGASAIFIGVVIPFSGLAEQIIMAVFGAYFMAAIFIAVISVRHGRIDLHRRWMIRAYAIASAILTMRLIFIPLLVVFNASTKEQTALFSIISFTLAFIIHGVAAEYWLRRTSAARA